MSVQIFYTVYIITNTINSNIYVGVHRTNNLDDGYMGSGKLIKRAIEKYGRDNFTKEYLAIYDNMEDMYEMESQIVNIDYLNSGGCYNISEGGFGDWSFVNKILTKEQRSKYGSWKNRSKRLEILNSIPLEKRILNGRKMGSKYGGWNKLSDSEINRRLSLLKDVDFSKYGWVSKVSNILNVTHTQSKRFINRNYVGDVYTRTSKKKLN